MKLEKFKKYGIRNKKIIGSVIGITIIIGIFILFKSFAFFESKYDFNIIKGRVPEFNRGDIQLALTLDGVKTDIIPTKGSYDVHVSCDNEAIGTWNYDNWSLNVSNLIKNKVKCNLNFITIYGEILLNGSYPTLGEEMIPITIGTGGVVTYADITSEWYSYEKKNWANAVILTNDGKTKNYTVGSTIEEADIESYFVWIPKYAYKIQTLGQSSKGQEKPFEIRFGITNTVDNATECIAPNVSGQNGKCAVGKYMTHLAFTSFGNIKGFWVGKFELTGNISSLTIKPNLTSLNNQSVSSFFKASYNYKRNLDSHMMKNTEWGATAYLTNSIYGRCTTTTCEEVYTNNNSNFITGWSGTSASAAMSSTSGYAYSNANSVKASTSNNYSGIYDMNGGRWEYMMSVVGELTSGIGGITLVDIKDIEGKYYDKYTTLGFLGDAVKETYEWFSDNWNIFDTNRPWFGRSQHSDSHTEWGGVFSYYSFPGNGLVNVSSRLVLAPL